MAYKYTDSDLLFNSCRKETESSPLSWRPYVKIVSLEVCFSHAIFIWPCLDAYVSKKCEKFFISSHVVRVSIDSGAAQYRLISKQE